MSLTIHFEGTLRSKEDLDIVIKRAREFAMKNAMDVNNDSSIRHSFQQSEGVYTLQEVAVPLKGISFRMHQYCEPFRFRFTDKLFIQEFWKTQFTDLSTHIAIVGFLHEIEPHFSMFKVCDDGRYWDTNNVRLLESRFEEFFSAFDALFEAFSEEEPEDDYHIDIPV